MNLNENVTIYYAEGKSLDNEVVKIKLKTGQDFINFLYGVMAKDDENTVYLFTSNYGIDPEDENNEHSREIYIESDFYIIYEIVLQNLDYSDTIIHLQEYESFQDAYKVALDMRESNKLCYNKKT